MLEIAICDDDAIILKTLGKYFGKLNDATIKYDIIIVRIPCIGM